MKDMESTEGDSVIAVVYAFVYVCVKSWQVQRQRKSKKERERENVKEEGVVSNQGQSWTS